MSKVGTHADLRTLTPATMQRWADDLGLTALPDFGEAPRRAEPCKPEELFRCLLELEDHVHYLEPAFAFALGALGAAELPTLRASVDAEGLVETLGAWARECAPRYASPLDPELAVVVAKEYGPAGLTDGAWLHGAMLANAVESEVGMRLLKQLMLRFAGPGVGEAYTQRYAALLRSAGILPASVLRRGHCLEISYEHALLGLCLGLFPTTFAAETVGFNLWMSAVGPCPLLELLADSLRTQGVNTRYLELHDRTSMAELAKQAVHFTLQDAQDDGARVRLAARIARGFCAAQRSYQRWARAMSGEEIDLDGVYAAPHELDSLVEQAFMCFGGLGEKELYHRLANADLFPAVRLFAREFVELAFARLAQVFRADPRLNSQQVPSYSERTIAEIVAAQHDKNVRSRGQPNTSLASSNSEEAINGIQEVFDGSWLQGFVDVLRADLEEYGWLFRIYASEHGDGDFQWNHCQIFRRAFEPLGPDVMLPKTDRRLYDLFTINSVAMVTLAVSLNTRRFMPEILGLNLGIEATGVGGSYMDQWKGAEKAGQPWRALAWRLHNSIDNYADGHTKWSLHAVQSFLRRVKDGSPESVDPLWERVWRLWRCRDILVHGTDTEQDAMDEHFKPGWTDQAMAELA